LLYKGYTFFFFFNEGSRRAQLHVYLRRAEDIQVFFAYEADKRHSAWILATASFIMLCRLKV